MATGGLVGCVNRGLEDKVHSHLIFQPVMSEHDSRGDRRSLSRWLAENFSAGSKFLDVIN